MDFFFLSGCKDVSRGLEMLSQELYIYKDTTSVFCNNSFLHLDVSQSSTVSQNLVSPVFV